MAYSTMILGLFLCIVARSCICAPLAISSDLSVEAIAELQIQGIKCPTPREMKVAKQFIYRHRKQIEEKDRQIGEKDRQIMERDQQIGKIQTEKEGYEIPLKAVKGRGQLEGFINDYWPRGKGKPFGLSYLKAMSDLLKSPHPSFTENVAIMELRKVIEKEVGIENFLEAFKSLYSKFSEYTHVVIAHLHKVVLPDYDDFKEIRKLLKDLGIKHDKNLVITLSLTLKPADLLPKREVIPLEEYRCVRLTGDSDLDQKKLDTYSHNNEFRVTRRAIEKMFQTTHPLSAEFHYGDKAMNFIKLHFENAKIAKKAHLEHNEWLNGIHFLSEHIPCKGYTLNGKVNSLVLLETTTPTSMIPIACD